MQVGLAGYGDIPTGLGILYRRLWNGFDFHLRYVHPHKRFVNVPNLSVEKSASYDELLRYCDAIVFIERPLPDSLVDDCAAAGKRTVCIPMCEWLMPDLPWLGRVDQFIAVTDQCHDYLRRLGYDNKTARCQMPLDVTEFPFRTRTKIESVVYLDGWGGTNERKGWPEVEKLLKLYPGILRIKAQRDLGYKGVEGFSISGAVATPADLYADADLVVVPGRYDGLGLTMLEAMASGCIVLATDAPPYRQFLDAAYGAHCSSRFALNVATTKMFSVWSHQWPGAMVDVAAMGTSISQLREMSELEVRAASVLGRAYVEREHGQAACNKLWEVICGNVV